MSKEVNNLIKAKYIDKHKLKGAVKKHAVPLGDCIKIEYSQEGEIIGFLIRPKLANLVFLKDKTDTANLNQILKIVIYLNRLLTKGNNLVVTKQRRNGLLKDEEGAKNLLEEVKNIKEADIFDIFNKPDEVQTRDAALQTEGDRTSIFLFMRTQAQELVCRSNRHANLAELSKI